MTSASTTPCCPSTRHDGCSGSIRGTRGGTRSEAAPAARQDGRMVSAAPPPRLVELAHAHGVATEYWDWQGRHVTVSAAAIRAVLTALGVEAEGDDAVERALADVELAPWRRTLPATVVCPRRVDAVGARPRAGGHRHPAGRRCWRTAPCARCRRSSGGCPTARSTGALVGEATFEVPGDLPVGWHRLVGAPRRARGRPRHHRGHPRRDPAAPRAALRRGRRVASSA